MLYVKNFQLGADSFVSYLNALEKSKRVKKAYKPIIEKTMEVFCYRPLLDAYLDAMLVVKFYKHNKHNEDYRDLFFVLSNFISFKEKYNNTRTELLELIETTKLSKNERDFFRLYVDYYYSSSMKDFEDFEKHLENEFWKVFAKLIEDTEKSLEAVEAEEKDELEQQLDLEDFEDLESGHELLPPEKYLLELEFLASNEEFIEDLFELESLAWDEGGI